VGAMIDFSPLLAQPMMVLLGAAGQFGIYGTLILATLLLKNAPMPANTTVLGLAASIGSIGRLMDQPPFSFRVNWRQITLRRSLLPPIPI